MKNEIDLILKEIEEVKLKIKIKEEDKNKNKIDEQDLDFIEEAKLQQNILIITNPFQKQIDILNFQINLFKDQLELSEKCLDKIIEELKKFQEQDE